MPAALAQARGEIRYRRGMKRAVSWVVVGCLGLFAVAAAAAPLDKPAPVLPKKAAPVVIDPVWTKQLAGVKQVPGSPVKTIESLPSFAGLKRLTVADKANVLKTLPEQLSGPLLYTARQTYHDDEHYLEAMPNAGTVSIRPLRNYLWMNGDPAAFASLYQRPEVVVHFRAQVGRRYLLECAVDVASGVGTVTAADVMGGASYAVNTTDRATLLYLHEATTDGSVAIRVTGDRPWYLDGCELSWS